MRTFVFSLWLLVPACIFGQSANNQCENAQSITLDGGFWCSGPGSLSNQSGVPNNGPAACFSRNGNDVWFAFTPLATDVVITVIGATGQGNGGTLTLPEVALYTGDCGSLQQLRCVSDTRGANIVELYKGGLDLGAVHYIQVQGSELRTGSFQLCVDSYNAPALPGSDANTAALLCNTESFIVENVVGGGQDPDEAGASSCLGGLGANTETNSTWFSWTAANDGLLTFTLTPTNPADDLDFVLYELPNGVQNGAGKIELRCMAAGDFNFPSPCMGPTGLREGSVDVSEQAGCPAGQDNFLAPLQLEAGKSYALLVNNFTSTGNGFAIDFGGTAEFAGPEADFAISDPDLTVCVGQSITLTDQSVPASGQITDWFWSFGPDADRSSATDQGPQTISFDRAGLKPLALRLTNDQGCVVTAIRNIEVECCPDHFDLASTEQAARCPQEATGSVDLAVNNPYGPYSYQWSNGQTAEDLVNAPPGNYTVLISDAANCDTTLAVEITGPPPLQVDTLLSPPTCNGGTDGIIQLVASGATPPFEFSWSGAPFTTGSQLVGLPVGDYDVQIRDRNGCLFDLQIPLRELELLLDPSVNPVSDPSCFQSADGLVVASVANGLGPYEFDWQDGQGFRPENTLDNLPAGTYSLEVRDANRCRGNFNFTLTAPPPLGVGFSITPVSCAGGADGQLTASATGGVGDFSYRWSGGPSDSTYTDLAAGTYPLEIRDTNNCRLDTFAVVPEPLPLAISLLDSQSISCFSGSDGEIRLSARGGTGPYVYRLDTGQFVSDSLFSGLRAGNYRLYVQDANGCLDSTALDLAQPAELVVDAGRDRQIQLGEGTDLSAQTNAGQARWSWTPVDSLSCTDCPNPNARPTRTTIYQVVVVDNAGCRARDSVTVTVLDVRPVYIPSAFSPNRDGLNDTFIIYGGAAASELLRLRIYDRWGGVVFERENLDPGNEQQGWDGTRNGKPLPTGVYVYHAEVLFINGEIQQYEGEVTLLR